MTLEELDTLFAEVELELEQAWQALSLNSTWREYANEIAADNNKTAIREEKSV